MSDRKSEQQKGMKETLTPEWKQRGRLVIDATNKFQLNCFRDEDAVSVSEHVMAATLWTCSTDRLLLFSNKEVQRLCISERFQWKTLPYEVISTANA